MLQTVLNLPYQGHLATVLLHVIKVKPCNIHSIFSPQCSPIHHCIPFFQCLFHYLNDINISYLLEQSTDLAVDLGDSETLPSHLHVLQQVDVTNVEAL
jgi:hypothetical protein